MAPNRGQRGRSRHIDRGGRGGGSGTRGRRGGRGQSGINASSKLARSGIRTRGGYKKFDSQRVKEAEPVSSQDGHSEAPSEESEEDYDDENDRSSDESATEHPDSRAYNMLIHSLYEADGKRKTKRRKMEKDGGTTPLKFLDLAAGVKGIGQADTEILGLENDHTFAAENDAHETPVATSDSDDGNSGDDGNDGEEDDDNSADPFKAQFALANNDDFSKRLKCFQAQNKMSKKRELERVGNLSVTIPDTLVNNVTISDPLGSISDWPLKEKLTNTVGTVIASLSELQKAIAPYMLHYVDLLSGNRTPQNASDFRKLACLHALNHILKGRDRVLKNNARLSLAGDSSDLDIRDQGFTRPKVLILLETRQLAADYADTITALFDPEQQENKQRFKESFTASLDDRGSMPEDYLELFSGNNDNNFLTGLKFTRKTLRYFAPFYSSDIIIASPLGLKRIIEHDDVKKRDHDFLSSVEICIVDQADAMQMQNWSHVELVFSHLNLQVQDAHGCDFNRVRSFYLDGHAAHFRQTLIFSAYVTPEMNRLFNTSLQNVAGKAKLTASYNGDIIASTAGLGIKQTFSRFLALSPSVDPDARFKYFTTAILPSLIRLPKSSDGRQGILIFIPSYFDFLRIRNFFATSTLTENISFGAIHDYTETSDQRRARSHFLTGRHSILLYTQRAHHFFRLKIRGVKRVVMYGLPDNSIFYQELIEGYVGTSINEGQVSPEESGVRVMFSKFEGLKLERIVGSDRVKNMLSSTGDTFDFL